MKYEILEGWFVTQELKNGTILYLSFQGWSVTDIQYFESAVQAATALSNVLAEK